MQFRVVVLLSGVVAVSACQFVSDSSMPPIVAAARSGNLEEMDNLLDQGADANVSAGVNHWTPLMHAIHKYQPGSVKLLLSRGALPDGRGGSKTTPLVMAAGYGYDDIVRLLLKAGADPHLKAANGDDALTAAVAGASDIDRFTVGCCQTETVRTIVANAPELKSQVASGAVRIARVARCSAVLDLLKQ